ncbi:hypothetical protein ACFQ88_23040 [Paenibacillus sp. NPDC056579]|uniref:hypothetical protein n=1 Tax=Paenibacillus sp. NPDC056579 TaxID=3345871 RepID=UPI0036BD2CBE
MIWDAAVDRQEFEKIANRLIAKYFKHLSYCTIEGKPVFMIYDLANLLWGLGGVEETKDALEWFRKKAVQAGLPGLHVQLILGKVRLFNLSGVDDNRTATTNEIVSLLGFDSLSHYQYIHFVDIDREWERIDQTYNIPY